MGNRTMAVRYAKALADVLTSEDDLRRVQAELEEVDRLARQHGDLRRTLGPAFPASRRRALAERLFGEAGFHPVLRRLLLLLAEAGRFDLVTEVTEAFMALADERRRIVTAEVTTAVELPAERAESYRRSLEQLTGRSVRMRTRVDGQILGGVVTRIGSEVYDGSLRGRLQRLQQRMKGE